MTRCIARSPAMVVTTATSTSPAIPTAIAAIIASNRRFRVRPLRRAHSTATPTPLTRCSPRGPGVGGTAASCVALRTCSSSTSACREHVMCRGTTSHNHHRPRFDERRKNEAVAQPHRPTSGRPPRTSPSPRRARSRTRLEPTRPERIASPARRLRKLSALESGSCPAAIGPNTRYRPSRSASASSRSGVPATWRLCGTRGSTDRAAPAHSATSSGRPRSSRVNVGRALTVLMKSRTMWLAMNSNGRRTVVLAISRYYLLTAVHRYRAEHRL